MYVWQDTNILYTYALDVLWCLFTNGYLDTPDVIEILVFSVPSDSVQPTVDWQNEQAMMELAKETTSPGHETMPSSMELAYSG